MSRLQKPPEIPAFGRRLPVMAGGIVALPVVYVHRCLAERSRSLLSALWRGEGRLAGPAKPVARIV